MVDKITTPVTPLEEVAKINEIIDNLGSGSSGGWSLLEHKWTEALLDDESWLLANNFSWHNKSAYEDAYNQLVDDIDGITPTTETVGSYTVTYYPTTSGRKIVLADQETAVSNIYTESGVAWYYILDTANQRFKLPRENPAREELIQVIRAKGNGMTLGLTSGALNFGLYEYGEGQLQTSTIYWDTSVGTETAPGKSNYANRVFGITTDSAKSGIISSMTDSDSVYKGKKYLYFYVGQYSQTATEQTAGLNTELFNGKADRDLNNVSDGIDFVVESKYPTSEDPTWYKLYRSGWIEQGGLKTASGTSGSVTISLLKEMANTNYNILITTQQESSVGNGGGSVKRATLSVSSFDYGWASMGLTGIYWEVKGMSAQS